MERITREAIKRYIEQTQHLTIVESASEVWRLEPNPEKRNKRVARSLEERAVTNSPEIRDFVRHYEQRFDDDCWNIRYNIMRRIVRKQGTE